MAVSMASRLTKFQSLMGFHVRCNSTFLFVTRPTTVFQSLMGFHVRCNSEQAGDMPGQDSRFQSLMGFHVRCNLDIKGLIHLVNMVSIPNGFSRSLQPSLSVLVLLGILVSIPNGFSRSLQRSIGKYKHRC